MLIEISRENLEAVIQLVELKKEVHASQLYLASEQTNIELAEKYARIERSLKVRHDPRIIVQKFKKSGKYYEEYFLPLLEDDIYPDSQTVDMYKIRDRISEREEIWLNQGGSVYITVEDIGYPYLITGI